MATPETISTTRLSSRDLKPMPFHASPQAYFNDGTTKIDFVIVYEEATTPSSYAKRTKEELMAIFKRKSLTSITRAREEFFAAIKAEGLVIEEDVINTGKKMLHFCKISAPWEAMLFHAERLIFRQPLEEQPLMLSNWSETIFWILRFPNPFVQHIPMEIQNFSTCPFRRSKTNWFLFSNYQDLFFSNRQRIRAVYEVVRVAPYGDVDKGEIGILQMVHDGIFTDAYALHDSTHKVNKTEIESDTLSLRQILDYYWASWKAWHRYQPLCHIREYFGEKVAFYFAWLGFYTSWLAPLALAGIITFAAELLIHFTSDPVAADACTSGNKYHMCPLCDDCEYWELSQACFFRRLGAAADSESMVFFSIFVSLWAVTFLEFWKRKSATLAYQWGRYDFSKEEGQPRPEYAARAPKLILNPITDQWEPYIPKATTMARLTATTALIITMMTLAIVSILAVLIYRNLVGKELTRMDLPQSMGSLAAIGAACFLQLIVMLLLGALYTRIASKLTEWEMLRTQAEFDTSLTIKIFLFQFVNFYSPLFYIAFFKQSLSEVPGKADTIFGMDVPVEKCRAGMCYVELCIQLLIILIGKQLLSNFLEMALPNYKMRLSSMLIKNWFRRRSAKNKAELTLIEEDYYLEHHPGFSEEYMEMVLQFGFVTIFVAAFPLAPLFAFINNITEIRIDAQKLTRHYRRPIPKPARDLGIWYTLLHAIVKVAVITNALLIAFTSDFLWRIIYKVEVEENLDNYLNFTMSVMPLGSPNLKEECRYFSLKDAFDRDCCFQWRLQAVKFIFILVYENAVFGLQMAIEVFVPDVPYKLEVLLRREHYLAKTALAGSNKGRSTPGRELGKSIKKRE